MILQRKRKVGENLCPNKHTFIISMFFLFKVEIAIPAEARGTVSVFRQFYHRLSLTIRKPDHLAQELCARGVIDESIVVSACVFVKKYSSTS